jgi:hypothetical protein
LLNYAQSNLFKNSLFEESLLPCLQVRDRATLYLNTLGGDGEVVETDKEVKTFLFGDLDIPLVNLETSLKNYVSFFPLLSHALHLFLKSSHVLFVDVGTF